MRLLDAFAQLENDCGWAKHFPAFKRYHARLPEVYALFSRFAEEAMSHGRRHFSAHFIVQRIRWETYINPKHYQGFKISNCHFPFYARLFMYEHECPDLFYIRELH